MVRQYMSHRLAVKYIPIFFKHLMLKGNTFFCSL